MKYLIEATAEGFVGYCLTAIFAAHDDNQASISIKKNVQTKQPFSFAGQR